MVTNKQIAAAFRNALPRLWDGKTYDSWGNKPAKKSEYICWAIHRHNEVETPAKNEARRIIEERLEGECSLEDWLVEVHDIDIYALDDKPGMYSPALQAHRKAWLEMLIAEFENKPD